MIHLFVALVVAQIDPSEPPPPLEEVQEEPPSRVEVVDPLVRCRVLINDHELERAAQCLNEIASGSVVGADPKEVERARAMLDVIEAWNARPKSSTTTSSATEGGVATRIEPGRAEYSVSAMIERGAAEGVLAGTIGGAVGGFTIAGAIFSATRTSERDSLPWLAAAPAVGALVGAAGSFAWIEYADPAPGDIALTWSTMMMGAAGGFNLQLAVFDRSPEVGSVPLRFLTVLGGGALGLGAGALLSGPIDATRGDIAVAHSAALWGGTLTTIGLFQITSFGSQIEFAQGVLIGGAGVLVPYAAAIAAHPFITIEYWPSWLIDAGGAAGVLTSFAALAVLGASGSIDGRVAPAIVGVGTAAGVALGSVAAVAVSNSITSADDAKEGE